MWPAGLTLIVGGVLAQRSSRHRLDDWRCAWASEASNPSAYIGTYALPGGGRRGDHIPGFDQAWGQSLIVASRPARQNVQMRRSCWSMGRRVFDET